MLLAALLLASPNVPDEALCTTGPQACLAAFYAGLPEGLTPQERSDHAAMYSREYLMGLLGIGSASQYTGPYKGSFEGRAFREKHPDRVTETLALFGYRYIEFKGSIAEGFELSHISPQRGEILGYNKYWWNRFEAARGWWYAGDLGFADHPPGKAAKLVAPCSSATIKGYLSPYGTHGHMAAYPHQLVVTEFKCD